MSKLAKLRHDPIGFCVDSRWAPLRVVGTALAVRQRMMTMRRAMLDRECRLDVIMTVYNTGAYVRQAVESVMAQVRRPDRLIIVDDASTDDSADHLARVAAEYPSVHVYRSPVNRGTYWCKNWALSQSTADFVAFHDSDDVSCQDRLAVQLGYLLDHPDVAACTTRWRRIDDDQTLIAVDGKLARMAPITLMMRRALVLARAGYFDTVRIAADSEYLARLSAVLGKGSLHHLQQVLYDGRLRPGSLTTAPASGLQWTAVEGADGPAYVREIVGDRAAYHAAFNAWHAGGGDLRVDFPLEERPFAAPDTLVVAGGLEGGLPVCIQPDSV